MLSVLVVRTGLSALGMLSDLGKIKSFCIHKGKTTGSGEQFIRGVISVSGRNKTTSKIGCTGYGSDTKCEYGLEFSSNSNINQTRNRQGTHPINSHLWIKDLDSEDK